MKHAPQFPVYIVSKGRWESRLTMKTLDGIGVPYHVVVEPQERGAYASVIDPAKLLVLDLAYKARYDTFSKLRSELGTGSGPARNFVWDHAVAAGAKWHWCVDDNIQSFHRLNHNLKVPVSDGAIFRAMEDFVLRYENVAMAGPNYFMFASRKSAMPPYILNTRIYSCNLIRNDVPFRWRGRYNEDTDLSLRMLKAGWCTVLFNAFLQYKRSTMTMAGGNTDTIYKVGTVDKSRMLVDMHPDVARMTMRFSRVHHFVDYSRFRRENRLVRKAGIEVKDGTDDYNMMLMSSDGSFLARMSLRPRRSPASSTTD